jgi:hypothetical protein
MIPAGLFSKAHEVRFAGTKIGINRIAMAQVERDSAVNSLKVQRRKRLGNSVRRLSAQERVDNRVQ